jgi:N6-adenosine-specific RNA methylase IME4
MSLVQPWPFGDLPRASYGVILADPPWEYALRSPKGEGKSPQAHYACMKLVDIKALPVMYLALPDCALVLWGTAPMFPAAIDVCAAWGFRYSTMGAWAKQSPTGKKWNMGPGYRLRSRMEPYIYATRGNPPNLVRNVTNLIVAPVREHSRKPDEMHDNLQRQFRGPFLELFSRQARPGWDAWGNETGKFSAIQGVAA